MAVRKKKPRVMVEWTEEYRCGCFMEAKRKKDLLGYCEKHGEEWRTRYKTTTINGKPADMITYRRGE